MPTDNNKHIDAIIAWGRQYLLSQGYTLKNDSPERVQDTPWSYVARFATTDGDIYLKHTPALLALEAPITRLLHEQFHAAVPFVIAHDAELNCFLMKGAGKSLRESLKKQFNATLLSKAIDQFSTLQLAVADHVNIFLAIGVPDWRLNELPALYQQLLSQKDVLMADGLSAIDINNLEALQPKLVALCRQLSAYTIKPSLVQCDFHDNNILIDESQNITFIDLGEIVISHPFFSSITCLRQAKFHHALTDKDEAYRQLLAACFKNHLVFESKKNLLDAFAIAQVLWFMYESLAQYRLMLACEKSRFVAFQRHGKLCDALKNFNAACI